MAGEKLYNENSPSPTLQGEQLTLKFSKRKRKATLLYRIIQDIQPSLECFELLASRYLSLIGKQE